MPDKILNRIDRYFQKRNHCVCTVTCHMFTYYFVSKYACYMFTYYFVSMLHMFHFYLLFCIHATQCKQKIRRFWSRSEENLALRFKIFCVKNKLQKNHIFCVISFKHVFSLCHIKHPPLKPFDPPFQRLKLPKILNVFFLLTFRIEKPHTFHRNTFENCVIFSKYKERNSLL